MKIPLYFLTIILLTSCQQSLIPTFTQADNKYFPSILKEKNDIILLVQNLEINDGLIIFDAEIRNYSDKPILIDPLSFYFQSFSFHPAIPKKTKTGSNTIARVWAMDEQSVADHYEHKIRERKAGNTFLAILAVGLVVTDACLDAKDANKSVSSESEYREIVKKETLRDAGTAVGLLAIDAAAAGNDLKSIKNDEDLYYLPDEYLRQTVLQPGDKCRGKVYFKKGEYLMPYYQVFLPIENELFVMDFKKETPKDRRRIKNGTLE